MSFSNRIKAYTHLSRELAALSDEMLIDLTLKAKPIYSGIGGNSTLVTIENTPIFVKNIPLTDLEKNPEHFLSTANFFELPLYYQYGVGSAGFGAWRELVTHTMATDWVLVGDCTNFHLLYHWRVLPAQPKNLNIKHWGDLENYTRYWENSMTIQKRMEAIYNSSASIVLFLEYVPQTLYQWLGEQLKAGESAATKAISFVDKVLKSTNDFINGQGLVHFDAHFENILTDGKRIYFSDFGLALSSHFDLTNSELDFLNVHRTYDRCATIVNFLHCIITNLYGKDQWEMRLREYMSGKLPALAPSIDTLIKQYTPIALVMDEFYQKLQKESKSTPYPATYLESLLANIDRKEEVSQK